MATDTSETLSPSDPTPSSAPRPARRLAWWQWAVFALLVGLLGLVAFQMRRNGPLAAGQVGTGEIAPDFELHTFDGGTVKLADLRGQVVVVNFWASWCVPCEEEAAALESTWQQYKDQGVVFLGVAWADTEPGAKGFIDQFGVTYTNGQDLGTVIADRYRITGVPETFIVGPDGVLRKLFVGPTTADGLRAEIEPLLPAAAD
jgi:cytochrome c biogenesis protein CcmG/thiol:disulfide interchange protein DsbE